MDIEVLEMSALDFKKIVLKKFRGKVFHITNEINYKSILDCGEILATNTIENPNINWGSEENMSYFRSQNCISVCDLFHNKDVRKIDEAMDKYSLWNPTSVVKDEIAYYLVLDESIYTQCITWGSLKSKKILVRKEIVRNFESGIPDRIRFSDISQVIKLVTTDKLKEQK